MSLEKALVTSVLGTVAIIAASAVVCKAADVAIALKGKELPAPVKSDRS